VPAKRRRTPRDERRRRLGQNFLLADSAERIVERARISPGELVLEIGAGRGALTFAMARRGARVLAFEIDPQWSQHVRAEARARGHGLVRVEQRDFCEAELPEEPFRVMGSVPFGHTTALMAHLFEDPRVPLARADLIVQWEVAYKRAAVPPTTLWSTVWAPWWTFRLGGRVPAQSFRPVPRVDAGVLVVTPRRPPLLPPRMARAYAAFVRSEWR